MCSWLGLIIVTVPALVILLWLVMIEEKYLARELGEGYREYQRHTARLLPGIW